MNALPNIRRIVVLGDSIAAGYGLPLAYAWPELLITHLAENWPRYQWALHNASIPGDTTPDAYVRFDAIRRQRPHLVIIALGINDCRQAQSPVVTRRIEHFRRNEQTWWGGNPILRRIGYRLSAPERRNTSRNDGSQVPLDAFLAILGWMVAQVHAMGALPALLTLSPLSPELAASPAFASCDRYNAGIRDIAREGDAALVEISYGLPADAWQADGVHLTAAGQAELAQRVLANVRRPPIALHLGLEVPASNAKMAPSLD